MTQVPINSSNFLEEDDLYLLRTIVKKTIKKILWVYIVQGNLLLVFFVSFFLVVIMVIRLFHCLKYNI